MGHWFIDHGPVPLATWREGFPGCRCVSWSDLAALGTRQSGMVWCRLPATAEAEAALADVRRYTALPVVVLSDAPDDAVAARAIAAGASGFCNTHAAPEVLRQVALVVENGGLWIGRSLVQKLVAGTARALGERDPQVRERWSDRLSEREREVAERVAQGASNKEIADQLNITERTVKAHLGAIFEKLGVRDRLQLSLRVNGARSGVPA